MIEKTQMSSIDTLLLVDSIDLIEITQALTQILYVPNPLLKPFVIAEISQYLDTAFSEYPDKIKVFIVYKGSEVSGYVSAEVHPGYSSRNRKCATFGWLHAIDFETCELLLEACEQFAREHHVKLIRGNINFPKGMGGIGIQESGFEEQMLYGVAFNDPKANITEYLDILGYKRDAEYVCMEVTHDTWEMGKGLDPHIKIRYLPNSQIQERKEEILSIARKVFYSVLPDAFGGDRFEEMMRLFEQIPLSHYILPHDFKSEDFSQQPEFLEAWNSRNLEEVNTFIHMAFARDTDELVGIIFCLPDRYQIILNKPITRVNVDTVMVKSGFGGKGIFSSLNNIGQLTGNMNGIVYYEGTGIWMVNEDAVRSILPHGRINRRFFVWQKRLKKA